MRIAICDDDKCFADKLTDDIRKILNEQGKHWEVQTYYSGTELLRNADENVIDAVYLDIDMPEVDGYEVADKLSSINNSIMIIFISSKSNMIFSSFKYHPFWFIRKSDMSELEYVICDMIRKWSLTNTIDVCEVELDNGNKLEIDLKNTVYIKSHDHYFQLKTSDNKLSNIYRGKMTMLEEKLADFWFVRIHSKYLVNLRFISMVETKVCTLESGEKIPIGRSKQSNTAKAFQNYKRSIR